MKNKAWLIAMVAALALSTGCSKEENKPAAAAAPAMEKSVEAPAQAPMDQTHEGMKPAPEAAMAPMIDGKAIYEKTCFACHDTGVSGAPKLGDKSAWAEHVVEGLDHLVQVAIAGEGAMPPRGGNPDLSDDEIRAAVSYMLDQGR